MDFEELSRRIRAMREELSVAELHPRLVWLALKAAERMIDEIDCYPHEEAARILFDNDLNMVRFALEELGPVAPTEDMPMEMYERLREGK